jgi:hypothetical protein
MIANLGGVSVVGDLTGASDDRDDAASGDEAKHPPVYHCGLSGAVSGHLRWLSWRCGHLS